MGVLDTYCELNTSNYIQPSLRRSVQVLFGVWKLALRHVCRCVFWLLLVRAVKLV